MGRINGTASELRDISKRLDEDLEHYSRLVDQFKGRRLPDDGLAFDAAREIVVGLKRLKRAIDPDPPPARDGPSEPPMPTVPGNRRALRFGNEVIVIDKIVKYMRTSKGSLKIFCTDGIIVTISGPQTVEAIRMINEAFGVI